MARRTRDGDGQFAAGIVIAEQNIRDRMAGFLAQIPAFKNRLHVFLQIMDGQRTAVEKKDNDRFAGRKHGRDQFLLLADQICRPGAVAHVFQRPRLARSLFVAADGQHDDIRLLGDLDSFMNLPAVVLRMAGRHQILVPRTAHGDFAAFAVGHLHPVAHLGADAFQQRGVKFGFATVAAEQFAVGIRVR